MCVWVERVYVTTRFFRQIVGKLPRERRHELGGGYATGLTQIVPEHELGVAARLLPLQLFSSGSIPIQTRVERLRSRSRRR